MGRRSSIEPQMLAEARAEISIADQKAGIVLAAAGIGFSAVLGGLLAGDWRPSAYSTDGEIVWWIAATLAFGVVASAAAALWPRFTTEDEDELVTYWAHVARYKTAAALTIALDDQPPPDRERTLHQLWRLAQIVRIKYWCVRGALVSGALAIIAFLIAGLVG